MLQRAQAAHLPMRWVVADTVYGHSPDLRRWLEEQGCAYALAVPSIEVVAVQTRSGCLLNDVASIAQRALRDQDWQRLSQSQGTKGPRLFDWARLPLVEHGTADGRHWLVFRRCLDEPHELAYYLVFAEPSTPLSLMVQAIGARWRIEEDLETAKDLGLDQYEVRSYGGWYRHLTLVLLAAAFLVRLLCASASSPAFLPAHSTDPLRSAASARPSPLACSHFGPAPVSVVPLSQNPSVLGRLLPSSPTRESHQRGRAADLRDFASPEPPFSLDTGPLPGVCRPSCHPCQ